MYLKMVLNTRGVTSLAIKSQGNIIRGFVKHVPQIKTIFGSNFETIISVSY